MKFSFLLAILTCVQGLACITPSYNTNISVKLDGKSVLTKNLKLIEGERTILTGSDKIKYMDVVATSKEDGVLLSFVLSKAGNAGEMEILGAPQILAKFGSKALIESQLDEKNSYTIEVTTKRNF